MLITSGQASQILRRKASPYPRPKEPEECNYITTNGAQLIVDRFTTAQTLANAGAFLTVHSKLPGSHISVIEGTQTLWTPLFDGGRLDAIKGGNAITVWVGLRTPDADEVANQAMAIVLSET